MVRPGCYSHILCNKTLYHNTFISFEIRVLAKLRVSSSKLPTCFRFGLADGIGDGVVPEGVAVCRGGSTTLPSSNSLSNCGHINLCRWHSFIIQLFNSYLF